MIGGCCASPAGGCWLSSSRRRPQPFPASRHAVRRRAPAPPAAGSASRTCTAGADGTVRRLAGRRRTNGSDARVCRSTRARSSSRRTTPAAASATTCSARPPSFVDLVTYYRTALKQQGRAGLRRAGDPPVRRRQIPRGDDGVSARRDDQGLPVAGLAGLSESRSPAAQPARFPTIIQIVPVATGETLTARGAHVSAHRLSFALT